MMRIHSLLLALGLLGSVLHGSAQQPGSLDTNYVTVAGTDVAPIVLAPTSEGKLYVGGTFTTYGGTGRGGFVRLLASGAVDTGFSLPTLLQVTAPVILNGQVLVPGSTNPGAISTALALPDGRAVIAGNFNRIGTATAPGVALLHPDGTPAVTGFDVADFEPGSLMLGPGNTFYVGGKGSLDPSRMPLLRFRPDGTRDPGFTPPTLAELGYQSVNPFILRPGPGDTLYVITAAAVGFSPTSDIVRLTASGALDTTFAVGGKAAIPFANLASFASDSAGRLYFTGLASFRGATLTRKINRVTLGGELDANYLVAADPGFGGRVIGVQADGKLLFTGGAAPINRLNADGTVDTGYANPTKVPVVHSFMMLTQFALAPDGSVFASGTTLTPTFTAINGTFHIWGDPNSAPTIAAEPVAQTVTLGARARFSVVAQGAAPLSYQWYRNGTAIDGATGSSLVLEPTSASDADDEFHCVVTNGQGSTPSTAARLTLTAASPGSVYRESDVPVGPDAPVGDLQWDSTGQLVAVGGFIKFHGTNRIRAARLSADGRMVDPTFDTSALSGPLGFWDYLVPLRNGTILVSGNQSISYGGVQHVGVLRLTANGGLDTTFNTTGVGGDISDRFSEGPDGSLFVAGSSWNGTPLSNGFGRLSADGARDAGFVPSPAFAASRALLALPNGKVLVAGRTNLTGINVTSSGVLRLNTDGTQDTSFYRGPLPGLNNPRVTQILRQPDGRILLAGSFTTTSELPARTFGVIRLLENGELDPSFNPVPSLSALDGFQVSKLALQADGRILIHGNFTQVGGYPRAGLARLWPNGVVDPDFAPGTPTRNPQSGTLIALAVSPDNAVFLGGDFHQFDGLPRTNFVRVNGGPLQAIPAPPTIISQPTRVVAKAGTDVTFTVEPGGTGPFQYQWRRNTARGSATFSDLAGATNASLTLPAVRENVPNDSGLYEVHVVNPGGRVTSQLITLLVEPDPIVPGTVDNAFAAANVSGLLTGQPQLTAPAPGGLLYASLRTTVQRLFEDGTPDWTFQPPADLVPANGGISVVALQPDGKVLLAGRMTPGALVRLLPDGRYDPTFVQTNNYTGFAQNVPWQIGLQSDGKILVAGNFENFAGRTVNGLLRFHPNGTVDDAFPQTAIEAVLSNPTRVLPGSAVSLRVLADDRIYIGGGFNRVHGATRVGVARLNADGTLDTAFVPPTDAATSLGQGGTMLFYTLGPVTPDGGVYLFGTFRPVEGQPVLSALRLLPTGTLDLSFQVTTDFQINFGAVQGDGKLIVTGQFTRLNGESRAGFARLNTDGSTDTAFVQGTTFGVGSPMSILPDGKLLVGGTRFFTGVGPELPAVDLEFGLTPGGLELTWPAGYRLQRSTQLAPANWQDVTSPSPFVVPMGEPGEYFRIVPAP